MEGSVVIWTRFSKMRGLSTGSMISLTVALIIVEAVMAQTQHLEEPKNAFYQAAPLHYVNIGAQLAGDYKFGYDTGKGPLGQSFREEIRLADGSVQGSYGVIDELGHKRVVHYTSGRSGPALGIGNNHLGSRFNNLQEQPRQSTLQQSFDQLRQQLPLFKPSNYLQARVVPLQYPSPNAIPHNNIEKRPTPVKNVGNRLPDPLLSDIVLPLYRTPVVAERSSHLANEDPQKDSGTRYAQQVSIPEYAPKASFVEYEQKSTSPPVSVQEGPVTRGPNGREARDQSPDVGLRKTEIQRIRVTKKPVTQFRGRTVVEEQPVTTAADIDYYDTVPAFIDIERLSYNIGSGRSTAH